MSATKADLRNRVLEDLRKLGAGQSPSAEDSQRVESAIDRVHEMLVRDGIATWATSAIPDYAVEPLTWVVGFHVAPMFGRPRDEALRVLGMAALRRLTTRQDVGEPVKAKFY